jgi:hypothetical protein
VPSEAYVSKDKHLNAYRKTRVDFDPKLREADPGGSGGVPPEDYVSKDKHFDALERL